MQSKRTINENNKANSTADLKATAETEEAERAHAATVPEKFGDVRTLVKAYSELEAEFTRRSQRLKELEQRENKTDLPPDAAAEKSSPIDEEELVRRALSSEKVRDAVIGGYLQGVAASSVPLAYGGGAVAAPRNAPRTVKEAGRLAREFLKK